MNCRELIMDVLHDYAEGQMDAATQEAFETHLADCPSCVTFCQTYRDTVSTTGTLRADDLPPEVASKLRSFLASRKQLSWWQRLWCR